MMRRYAPLIVALGAVAGCADLIGVETLSGTDAGIDAGIDAAIDAGADAPPSDDGGCQIAWVDANGGAFPTGAVPNEPVGDSGFATYVCRVATATEGVVPGKLLPGYYCYYGDGTVEQHASDYQVLVPTSCSVVWAAAPQGVVYGVPLVCGEDADGETLFSCRVGEGIDQGELGHEGSSTGYACIYSLSGMSLSNDTFDVLTAH